MSYQIRVKQKTGEFIYGGVVREPTPIIGSTVQLMLGGHWTCVQLVGLSKRMSEGGELLDHLEGDEV
jgi:hypothetical protein